MQNKRIFISGGAGFLGKHIVDRYYGQNDITVFSRDEAKHYYLSKLYPEVRFIIGDIRNYDLLKRSSKHHDIGIFTASLKQIDTCSHNTEEALHTIVHGAFNSKRSAIENDFESACFISTDKSRAATTIYGSMKYIAGESFILGNENINTRLTTVIYGNVMNSTGSLIPLIWSAINNKIALILYEEHMTRFMIDVEEAINVIESSLELRNVNVIPNLKSFLVKDIFDLYEKEFGLKYIIGKPRINEKIHEIMASSEEIPRMKYLESSDCYMMHPLQTYNEVSFKGGEYSSMNNVISKKSLRQLLSKKDFYQ